MSVVFSVSLDPRLADKLHLYARRHGLKRRAVVANALDFYLNAKAHEKPVDAWVYEPVPAALLDTLTFAQNQNIQTKGELVAWLVVHKGWAHEAAAQVVNGEVEVEFS